MNLNKSICKRCWNKHFEKISLSTKGSEWNESDEQSWENGTVICLVSYSLIDITEIPKGCPYSLEHLTQQ